MQNQQTRMWKWNTKLSMTIGSKYFGKQIKIYRKSPFSFPDSFSLLNAFYLHLNLFMILKAINKTIRSRLFGSFVYKKFSECVFEGRCSEVVSVFPKETASTTTAAAATALTTFSNHDMWIFNSITAAHFIWENIGFYWFSSFNVWIRVCVCVFPIQKCKYMDAVKLV